MDRLEKLREFLADNPRDSFVQHALALEYIKLQDDKQARYLFEKLLTENPDYIGSYYHFAKLLERNNEREMALTWYQKGMQKARAAADNHTYSELLGAYEELNDG